MGQRRKNSAGMHAAFALLVALEQRERTGKGQHVDLTFTSIPAYSLEGIRFNEQKAISMDIRKFFDTLDHGKLREILAKRIGDGVIRKLIDKWLKAGVMENGEVSYNDEGTPQGGVISPLLSNIYLHEVLDDWFVKVVQPRMQGKSFMIRFADDAVLGFETKADAERVMAVLPKRFEKYGLTVHPEKTQLIDMRMPTKSVRDERSGNNEGRGSFAYLGFRHYWAKSRNGYWVIKRKTEQSRLARSIKKVTDWLKENRHISLEEQQAKLWMKMRGHYGYYGITSNFKSLSLFYNEIRKGWRKWLARRSRKGTLSWEKFADILKRFPLPEPRIVHSDA